MGDEYVPHVPHEDPHELAGATEQADADDPMTGEGNASTAAERPVRAPTLFERFGEWLTR